MQTYLGIPSPCAGGVFAGGVHASGAVLPHGSFRRVGIECEIAVRLARDLVPGEAPFAAADVGPAIESFMAAIEIVDDRYVDWRKTDTPTLVADDFFAAGAVLGTPVPAAQAGDPAAFTGSTRINGEEVGRGRGRDVMGTPLNALAWLANSLAERGMVLKSGEIVLLGSLVETKWLAAGDHVRIAVAELGPVELTVT
jgi:2-oxo-3-hexenedioate decarboxylase/2-keto-4-pentenoate hydratase